MDKEKSNVSITKPNSPDTKSERNIDRNSKMSKEKSNLSLDKDKSQKEEMKENEQENLKSTDEKQIQEKEFENDKNIEPSKSPIDDIDMETGISVVILEDEKPPNAEPVKPKNNKSPFHCGVCCAKTVLIIVNVIFEIIGFVLLVVGILLTAAWSLISDLVQPLLEGILGAEDESESDLAGTATGLLSVAGYIFIGLGLFMMIAGSLGCCGACCKIKNLLIIYTILVLLVFLPKLIMLILLITAALDSYMKTSLQNVIDTQFKGIEDTSLGSFALNIIMINYNCCGITNYQDFNTAAKWDRYNYEVEYEGETRYINLATPVACCKTSGVFPDITLISANCTWEPTNDNSNWNIGCWDTIKAELDKYENMIMGVYGGLLGFEGLCIGFAIFLIHRAVKDEKDGKINPMLD